MTPFPIRNDHDLARALAAVDELWNAAPGSPEAETLEVIAQLVDAYEDRHRHEVLPPANPRVVLQTKLRELAISQRELGRRLGWGSGRVSEVLSGKRPLTLAMVRALSRVLDLPPGLLVHDVVDEPAQAGVGVAVTASVAQVALSEALVRRLHAAGYHGPGAVQAAVESGLECLLMMHPGLYTTAANQPQSLASAQSGPSTTASHLGVVSDEGEITPWNRRRVA